MKRIIIMILVILLICFSPISSFADNEENNSYDTAENLSLNSTISGTVGGTLTSGDKDYRDYYKIMPTADGSISITVSSGTNIGSVYLYYLNSNNTLITLAYDSNGSDGFSVVDNRMGKGTYYIGVNSASSGIGNYSLTNNFTPVSEVNDESIANSNDVKETAKNLSLDSSVQGHIGFHSDNGSSDHYDYYKVVTTSDGKFEASIPVNTNISDLYLFYVNSNNTLITIAYDSNSSDGFSIVDNRMGKGTYYLRVGGNSAHFDGYTLTNKFTKVLESNDELIANSNDNYSKAKLLTLNDSIEGHIGFHTDDGLTDSYDYYKIVTTNDGKFTANISSGSNIGNIYLFYLNSNNTLTTIAYDSNSSDGFSVVDNRMGKGTYYLKIGGSSAKYGGYTITNSLVIVPELDDENVANTNDSKETAKTLNLNSSVQGHIGFRTDKGIQDYKDYYKITTTEKGNFKATIPQNTNVGSLYMYYENSSGSLVTLVYDSNGSDGFEINKNDLEAKEYYLAVGGSSASYDGYTLTNEFTNESGGVEDILVTQIELSSSSATMEVGDEISLVATITPENATDKTVTWTSSNESVASVSDSGVIKAIKEGQATIKAQSSNNSIYATCVINVEDNSAAEEYTLWTQTSQTTVSKDKEWIITFNDKLNLNSVNNNNFFVKDSSNNNVNVNVSVTDSTNKKVSISPLANYQAGAEYTLYISKNIIGEEGNSLTKGIKLVFNIEGSIANSGQNILAHRGFDFSQADFRLDSDAYDPEFKARKDGSIIFWEPVEAGDEGRGEQVWIECWNEEAHINTVADMGAVSFESVTDGSNAVFNNISPYLQVGHVYIVKTREGGYAKIYVLSTDPDNMTAEVKWQYSQNGQF